MYAPALTDEELERYLANDPENVALQKEAARRLSRVLTDREEARDEMACGCGTFRRFEDFED